MQGSFSLFNTALAAALLLSLSLAMTSPADTASPSPRTPTPAIEVVQVGQQPWYEAEDKAVAREIASPRNSRAQTLSIADIIIPAGVAVKPHYHKVIEEIYYVTGGSGLMTIDGKSTRIGVGDAVVIRPGERHSVHNDTSAELRLLVTCTPPWTPDCLVFD